MGILQPLDLRRHCCRARLDPTMTAVDTRLGCADLAGRIIEKPHDIVMQRGLVGLQGQRVITALVRDLLGYATLAVERIRGDNRAFQRQHRRQFRHRGDLVRLGVGGDLSQDQALLTAPGTDPVQRRLLAGTIERAAENLAINSHNTLTLLREPGHEALKRSTELLRVELADSRLKVSWLGTPLANFKKPRRTGSFALANSAMSTAPWPPHRTVQRAIIRSS